MAETFVLAVGGAVLGLAVSQAGIELFNSTLATVGAPLWLQISLDPVGITFILGLVLVATVAAGTTPALRASQEDVSTVLNDETRGSSAGRLGRVSTGLVIAEIAVSCGLLIGAGLIVQSVVNLGGRDYGFNPARLFTARIDLDRRVNQSSGQFFDELTQRLEASPVVRSVGLTSSLPASGAPLETLSVDGVVYPTAQDHPEIRYVIVTPDYFTTLDVAPRQGRTFSATDGETSLPVAVINERFVARFFSTEDPLRARIRVGDSSQPWRTIVGVVPDLYLAGMLDSNHEASTSHSLRRSSRP